MPRGRRPFVWHGLDPGVVVKYRKVEDSWQYEALVHFGNPDCSCSAHGPEWIPVIELSYVQT